MDSHTLTAKSSKHSGSHRDKVALIPGAWHTLLEILCDKFSLRIILSDPRVTLITRFQHGKSFLRAQLELYCFWPALIPLADGVCEFCGWETALRFAVRPAAPLQKQKTKTYYGSNKAFSWQVFNCLFINSSIATWTKVFQEHEHKKSLDDHRASWLRLSP